MQYSPRNKKSRLDWRLRHCASVERMFVSICGFSVRNLILVATAEAAALVAEADIAAAVVFAAAFETVANGCQHVAAFRIAAATSDGAAVLDALAFAFALIARKVEAANLHAVSDAVACAIVVANRFAKALQVRAFRRVIAAAKNAETADELLE